MSSVVVIALIGLGLYCLCTAGTRHTVTHTRGGAVRIRSHVNGSADLRDAARHEGGHGAVGRHVRGRVGRAVVNPDGSGWIDVTLPASATTAQRIAVSLAGVQAEGKSIHHRVGRGDKANIDHHLRGVAPAERAAVMAEARRIAARGLSAQSGTANRIARGLVTGMEKKGIL